LKPKLTAKSLRLCETKCKKIDIHPHFDKNIYQNVVLVNSNNLSVKALVISDTLHFCDIESVTVCRAIVTWSIARFLCYSRYFFVIVKRRCFVYRGKYFIGRKVFGDWDIRVEQVNRLTITRFLADSTNGRTYATVLRPSVAVSDIMYHG